MLVAKERSGMNVFIRKARADDIPGIVAMWKEFMKSLRRYNANYWETKNGEQVFAQYLEDVYTNAHTLVAVAETDRKLVGFTLAYIEELPEWFGKERIGLIRYLAVSEKQQGKGVGQQMASYVMEWFRTAGIKRIELYVLKGIPASGFWAKLGFKEFMDRRFLNI
jgi:GNAT superfamily N-acetyltransferase